MKHSIIYIILLAAMVAFGACEQEDPEIKALREYTISQESFGMYQDNAAIWAYDEDVHQMAYNSTLNRFRFQTDGQEKILQMTLDATPKKGEYGTLSLYTRGLSGIKTTYDVQVIAMDEDKNTVWLMCRSSLTGFVMYYDFK